MFKAIKSAAVASLVVLATTAGAFAATAVVVKDTGVKKYPKQLGVSLDIAHKGEKLWIVDCKKYYCFAERKWGPDGWVLKSHLKALAPVPKKPFPGYYDGYYGAGVSFCVGGAKASFCIQGYN